MYKPDLFLRHQQKLKRKLQPRQGVKKYTHGVCIFKYIFERHKVAEVKEKIH